MNILVVQSSARLEGSVSRTAAHHYLEALRTRHPDARATTHDLALNAPRPLDPEVLGALFTPAEKRTPAQHALVAPRDALIADLKAADQIVLAVSMYNFAPNATLKAWFDTVIRCGETFSQDKTTGAYTGLLSGKRAVVIVASGGNYTPGSAAESYDHATPYVKLALGFMGVTDVTVVPVPDQQAAPDTRAAATTHAHLTLASLSAPT